MKNYKIKISVLLGFLTPLFAENCDIFTVEPYAENQLICKLIASPTCGSSSVNEWNLRHGCGVSADGEKKSGCSQKHYRGDSGVKGSGGGRPAQESPAEERGATYSQSSRHLLKSAGSGNSYSRVGTKGYSKNIEVDRAE